MTTSTDRPTAGGPPGELIGGPGWRERARRIQDQALPSGQVVVSCPAPFGAGGLGRHVQEIADALERRAGLRECICEPVAGSGPPSAPRPLPSRVLSAAAAAATRPSPAWRMWRVSVAFDRQAARRLRPADHLLAFNGTALAQFRSARDAGVGSLSLVSANSHMRRVIRQHERAYRQYPVERPWSTHLLRRNLREYDRAERIYVSSSYVRESFLEQGFPEESLPLFPLTPHPRYRHGEAAPGSGTFDIVYVGSLLVHKGVPLLIEAFRRLPHADMRLVLVGGWKSPGMRRHIRRACGEDPRISVSPGDPLPHMRRSRLCVHPAYEDGFAYAPAEALACGIPVIVTEDTGMKDLIASERQGLVLPTGDASAFTDAIDAAYRGEILSG